MILKWNIKKYKRQWQRLWRRHLIIFNIFLFQNISGSFYFTSSSCSCSCSSSSSVFFFLRLLLLLLLRLLQLQLFYSLLVFHTLSWSLSNYIRVILFLLIFSLRVFHISFSWWSFTGVRVTASLLKFPGLFSVFWPFSVVWMVSTRPPTSKSSSSFINHLVTVPKQPITIGIIVDFMFQSFFNSLARSRYLSFFSHPFSFILWSAGTVKSTILQILFFFVVVDYYKVWSSSRD